MRSSRPTSSGAISPCGPTSARASAFVSSRARIRAPRPPSSRRRSAAARPKRAAPFATSACSSGARSRPARWRRPSASPACLTDWWAPTSSSRARRSRTPSASSPSSRTRVMRPASCGSSTSPSAASAPAPSRPCDTRRATAASGRCSVASIRSRAFAPRNEPAYRSCAGSFRPRTTKPGRTPLRSRPCAGR